MAKVKGPLMSMEASGTFGKAITFSTWKGRAVVRQHIVPRNPNSTMQAVGRNRIRITGNLQKWMNHSPMKEAGQTMTDKERLIGVTPNDQVWNSYLVSKVVGPGGMAYNNATSSYEALSDAEKTAWDTAAKNLSPALEPIFQKADANGTDSVVSAGQTFFIYRTALASLNLATSPSGTPPTYA